LKNSRKSVSTVKGVFGNILFKDQTEDLCEETSMFSSQACLGEDCWDKSFRRVSHWKKNFRLKELISHWKNKSHT